MRRSRFVRDSTVPALETIATRSPKARAVIINIPGYRGEIRGFNNKYGKIGAMLSARNIGAFVLMPNRVHEFQNDYTVMVRDLEAVIDSVSRSTSTLCAVDEADIYLMGTSAGGAGVAAIAGHFPRVKKILLVAPAFSRENRYRDIVEKSMANYAGEMSIVVGKNDTITGPDEAQEYLSCAQRVARKRFEIIPDCDHQFKGERNGMILSKAPLWAFAGEKTFPSPEGGLKLY